MTQQIPPTSENKNTPADDPFAHLHKMSTTAGVGSTEYVAVNIPSVVAILLGLASALCLMDPIFFIIPVAALVLAVIALVQVSKSNGTQTGKGLATLAILFALGFAGFKGYTVANQYMIERRESAAIGVTISQFEADLKAGEYDKAYTLTGPKFSWGADVKERAGKKVTPEDFSGFFKMLEGVPIYGRLHSMTWNGVVKLETDQASGGRYAVTMVRMSYEKSPNNLHPHDVVLHRIGDEWKIEQISGYFGAASSE